MNTTLLPGETLVTLENIEVRVQSYFPTERECDDNVMDLFDFYCADNFLNKDDDRNESWDSFLNYVEQFGLPRTHGNVIIWVPSYILPTRGS